jgi:hypothetical protein
VAGDAVEVDRLDDALAPTATFRMIGHDLSSMADQHPAAGDRHLRRLAD